jgi:hypothetical protein
MVIRSYNNSCEIRAFRRVLQGTKRRPVIRRGARSAMPVPVATERSETFVVPWASWAALHQAGTAKSDDGPSVVVRRAQTL